MITIIYPRDNSTSFLLEIADRLLAKFSEEVSLFIMEANDNSYNDCLQFIKKLEPNTLIIFMGHGQDNLLYGSESDTFEKKAFIKRNEFSIFRDKYLFSLSCYSNELLKASLGFSKILNSIGFGILPSEIKEVEGNKSLKSLGVTKEVIDRFKIILVDLIVNSFDYFLSRKVSLNHLSEYLRLLICKKISSVILDDKQNPESRILANLLYLMKSELVYY